MTHFGIGVKDKKYEQIKNHLSRWLDKDEVIIALFNANHLYPLVTGMVLTNRRMITIYDNGTNIKAVSEICADDILDFTTEKEMGKFTKLMVIKKNGEKLLPCTMSQEDILVVSSLIAKMSGTPQPIAEKIYIAKTTEKAEHNRIATEQKQQQAKQAAQARRERKQALVDAKQLASDRAKSGQCPKCGSNNLQAVHSSTKKGFSNTGAAGGCCLLGPVGLLCGLCNSGQTQEQSYRMCLNCGNKF